VLDCCRYALEDVMKNARNGAPRLAGKDKMISANINF